MNYALVRVWLGEVLLGIYPTHAEALFIKSKVAFQEDCEIRPTENAVTTDLVGRFLKTKGRHYDRE